MEEIYNIMLLVIKYGIWVFFGLDILVKLTYLLVIRKKLGKNYHTIPDVKKYSSIRKTSIILAAVLFLVLLFAVLVNGTPIHIPFIALFMCISLYLGGKFQLNFGFNGTMLYSENGFILYKSGLFLPFFHLKLHKWDKLSKVIWNKNYPFTKWLGKFYFEDKSSPSILMTGKFSQQAIEKLLVKKSVPSVLKKSPELDGSVPDTSVNLN